MTQYTQVLLAILLASMPPPNAHANTNNRLARLDFAPAVKVAAAIWHGHVTSEQVTQRRLERIERFNPQLNAVVVVNPRALDEAREADRLLRAREVKGPLHGVPVTVSDLIDIAGLRTTAGIEENKDHVPTEDAEVVKLLRNAGMVILGHDNVAGQGWDWNTTNPIYGTTNNAWDRARTAGGAAGGGAVAVAAGLTDIAATGDFGGSARHPAGWNGIFGHRVTLDLVPFRGYLYAPDSPTWSLPSMAFMARHPADIGAILQVTAVGTNNVRVELAPPRAKSLQEYRVGYVLSDPDCPLTEENQVVLRRTIETLRRAGAQIDPEGWPADVDAQQMYERFKALAYIQDQKNTGDLPANRRQRLEARSLWEKYFETHDVFLLPNEFLSAFKHCEGLILDDCQFDTAPGRQYSELLWWSGFPVLPGLPATVAPVGLDVRGLPVAVQILGPYHGDLTTLDFAAKLSKVLAAYVPPPGYGM